MADQVSEALLSLAQGFGIAKIPGAGAHSFQVSLSSPLSERELSIVENLVETVIKPADIDLSFLIKDVRFTNSKITDTAPIGGQPILNILAPGLTFDEQPAAPVRPGVAGLTGLLKGTIPIAVQENVASPLAVGVDVQWSVVDGSGNPAGDVKWTLGAAQGQGGYIPLQPGQALQPLALAFTPEIVEPAADLAPVSKRTVRAAVRLTARDANGAFRATSGWIELPPLEVILPVIPVPTVAIFFSGTFAGDTLIAVPGNSLLEEGTLISALDDLNAILGPIHAALDIGGLFVSSLGDIKHALANNVTRLKFRKGDSCGDLRDVQFAGASFTDWNGEDGDDHFASMMLIGPPNRSIECFNGRKLAIGEGQFVFAVNHELHATIESLGSATPASVPQDSVAVPHPPDGWRAFHDITDFKNELSSYRFGWV